MQLFLPEIFSSTRTMVTAHNFILKPELTTVIGQTRIQDFGLQFIAEYH